MWPLYAQSDRARQVPHWLGLVGFPHPSRAGSEPNTARENALGRSALRLLGSKTSDNDLKGQSSTGAVDICNFQQRVGPLENHTLVQRFLVLLWLKEAQLIA